MTLNKNTTRHRDWPTPTTTKCLTFCFVLKNMLSYIISLKLMGQIQWNFTGRFLWLPSTKCQSSTITTTTTKWPTSWFALKHLLWNCQANFNKTLQESSLHDSLQKMQLGVEIDQQQQQQQQNDRLVNLQFLNRILG